ncbi:angiotensin-converting enzyme [Trichonephila clavipes]|nr:angiotensin-converting enzyme [Trichonephila clavipes]
MAIQEEKLQPLYKEIHAYIRKKLIQNHKKETIKKNGPIPAHLLGDMYAQTWVAIFPTVKPYPDARGFPNVTKKMLEKKMKPIDLFIMAENFFTSIGLKTMTPYFWKYSLMERPKDGRSVDCHASAHDFYDGKDYRKDERVTADNFAYYNDVNENGKQKLLHVIATHTVVKAPKSEGVVDPKSGERRLVSLLLSGSRGKKSAPKGDSCRCV